MAQVQAGSIDRLGELYDRYGGRAYRLARSICHDDDCAEQAVQEAFVSIWRSRASYRPQRGTVAAWLLTVVRRRALDIDRRHDSRAAQPAAEDRRDGRPDADDVAAQAVARVDAGRVRALLARLPDAQQEVITLAFYGQLTHTEIAEQLGLPPGAIKGRMRLGLDKLHHELAREPDG